MQNHIVLEIKLEDKEKYKRLDHFLNDHFINYSRSFLKNLFEKDLIVGKYHNNIYKLQFNKMPPNRTQIFISIPSSPPKEIQPENLPLQILYEDEDLLLVDKEAGMVTYPAIGHLSHTLANALLFHYPEIKDIGDRQRPGIVHRLDKGTSGVMVIAKTQQCYHGLLVLFTHHNIQRFYEALCIGRQLPQQGTLRSNIGRHPYHRIKMAVTRNDGKPSMTSYRILKQYSHFTHMQFKLETGRTHQIRVHTSTLLHAPILNDPLYGRPSEHKKRIGPILRDMIGDYPYPFLHAKILGFIHPISKKKIFCEAKIPLLFEQILRA